MCIQQTAKYLIMSLHLEMCVHVEYTHSNFKAVLEVTAKQTMPYFFVVVVDVVIMNKSYFLQSDLYFYLIGYLCYKLLLFSLSSTT